MRTTIRLVVIAIVCAATPSLAFAQRFPFERTIQLSGTTRLDVSTLRGKIEVLPGDPGRIVVEGAVTVRVGWNVPADAVEIARKIAATPPIDYAGGVVRLRDPADEAAQRAVTVNYRVRVPPATEVRSSSDSGATTIRGVSAAVDVQTKSAAIDLSDLSGAVQVSTSSGAVVATDVSGALSVKTSSSGFSGSRLGSSLRVRTQSGEIIATLSGTGDVSVETGSSAIKLRGVRGGLDVQTQSGRVTVQGAPVRDWKANTASSSVSFDLETTPGIVLDLVSRSGNVDLSGMNVTGSVTKHAVKGTVGNGGPTVMVRTGSGAIRLER